MRGGRMRMPPSKKEALRKTFITIPLPFSKWLYAFARSSVFPNTHQPYFDMAFQRVKSMQLDGDYLEFGVYQGISFILAASMAEKNGLKIMRYFAFDSFEGLPEAEGKKFNKGDYCCSEEGFTRMIRKAGVPLRKVVKVKGWYDETLTSHTKKRHQLNRAAVVHVDCDLYSSAKVVLAFVEDLVQVGTVLIFDDWYAFCDEEDMKGFGEQKAFNEWPLKDAFEDFYDGATSGGVSKAFIMTRANTPRH
jgi:O-methyltransferase